MFDNFYNIGTWNIRKLVVEYIMSLKRKRRMKPKAKSCAEDKYHLIFNNVLTTSPDILQSNTHKGCCVLNTMECNYKLRSVIRREDQSKVTKWTWFNKEVSDTFLCSWMVSRKVVDHTNIGRTIVSTSISMKGIPITILTHVSKEWNYTVISTDISTK